MKKLIPTIIQDYKSKAVYMLGYSSVESLKKIETTGYVWFWSRSRKRLWMKGEESGNKLRVEEMYFDCDQDSLLIKVSLEGKNVCHSGNLSCFFTSLSFPRRRESSSNK